MAKGIPLDDSDRALWLVLLHDWSRMEKRTDRYMTADVQSQFETLEEPSNARTIDISLSVDDIVREIVSNLSL